MNDRNIKSLEDKHGLFEDRDNKDKLDKEI